jgi:hypothetical protein
VLDYLVNDAASHNVDLEEKIACIRPFCEVLNSISLEIVDYTVPTCVVANVVKPTKDTHAGITFSKFQKDLLKGLRSSRFLRLDCLPTLALRLVWH